MTTIAITAGRREIRERFFPSGAAADLFLDLSVVHDYEAVRSGEFVTVRFAMGEDGPDLTVTGMVSWKRPREIKLPGRVMPAGIGIKLDERSSDAVEDKILKEESELSDLTMMMVGGNYIRVRHDIASLLKKRREERSDSESVEKRRQPRIGIAIPIDVFANNQVASLRSRDISLLGMSIETGELMPVGEEIVLIFEDEVLKKQFIIKATVVRHIPSMEDSSRMIGIGVVFQFENETQKKELMNFIVRHT